MTINIEQLRQKSEERYKHNVTTDPSRLVRLERGECKGCYYAMRIAGQAFTEYICQNCQKEFMHSNTDVPKLCLDCAKNSGLCAHCMKTID